MCEVVCIFYSLYCETLLREVNNNAIHSAEINTKGCLTYELMRHQKNVVQDNIVDTNLLHSLQANTLGFISERTKKYGVLYS